MLQPLNAAHIPYWNVRRKLTMRSESTQLFKYPFYGKGTVHLFIGSNIITHERLSEHEEKGGS
jgi:hypothetical protein